MIDMLLDKKTEIIDRMAQTREKEKNQNWNKNRENMFSTKYYSAERYWQFLQKEMDHLSDKKYEVILPS